MIQLEIKNRKERFTMGMAEKIKEKRLEQNLTQEELAKKLGLQIDDIISFENGNVDEIKSSIIYNMTDILQCSFSSLMGLGERFLDIRRISKDNHDMTYKEIKILVEEFNYYFSDQYEDTDIQE